MELIINDRIRNRKIEFFNSFDFTLKYNSFASPFSLDFYFDPNVSELKEVACVGHYHICQLKHNGELLITGIVLSEAFDDASVKSLVPISGYAIPGILEDCSIPTNKTIDNAIDIVGNLKIKPGALKPYVGSYQSDGLSLKEIAVKLLAPFDIKIVIDPSVQDKMEKEKFLETTADAKDTIKKYLTDLALQKNINITHTAKGELYFTRVKTDLKPILDFNVPKGGAIPATKMQLKFNGQAMHSQITVIRQSDVYDPNAGESVVHNPYVPFIFRPKTIEQTSGSNVDTELAAKNARAEELRNMTLTVTIDRWDINKRIIRPNNLISVTNPNIYLYKKTNWFIESIQYKGNEKQTTAVLNCVLPSCYDGTEPKYIFSGINLH